MQKVYPSYVAKRRACDAFAVIHSGLHVPLLLRHHCLGPLAGGLLWICFHDQTFHNYLGAALKAGAARGSQKHESILRNMKTQSYF